MKTKILKKLQKLEKTKEGLEMAIASVPASETDSTDPTLTDYENDLHEIAGEMKGLEWAYDYLSENSKA